MNKIIISILLIFIINNKTCFSQSDLSTPFLDSIKHIKITKIIYYKQPYVFVNKQPIEKEYVPIWYKSYCANSNPSEFKSYVNDALDYFHSSSSTTRENLEKQLRVWKDFNLNRDAYNVPVYYCYGEIWFTNSKTNEKAIFVLIDFTRKDLSKIIRYDEIDVEAYRKGNYGKIENIDTCDVFYKLYTERGHTWYPFILEDNIYKWADAGYANNLITLNKRRVFWKGDKFWDFKKLIERSDCYYESLIYNGKRVFYKMVNTPHGFIKGKEELSETYINIKTVFLILAIVLSGLAFFVYKKRSKRNQK